MGNLSSSYIQQHKMCNSLGCFFLSTSERRHKLAAFRWLLRSIPRRRVANGNRYRVFSHLVSIHLQHSLCRRRLHTHRDITGCSQCWQVDGQKFIVFITMPSAYRPIRFATGNKQGRRPCDCSLGLKSTQDQFYAVLVSRAKVLVSNMLVLV